MIPPPRNFPFAVCWRRQRILRWQLEKALKKYTHLVTPVGQTSEISGVRIIRRDLRVRSSRCRFRSAHRRRCERVQRRYRPGELRLRLAIWSSVRGPPACDAWLSEVFKVFCDVLNLVFHRRNHRADEERVKDRRPTSVTNDLEELIEVFV